MCVHRCPQLTGGLTEAHSCATNTNATQHDVFVRLRGASWWVLDRLGADCCAVKAVGAAAPQGGLLLRWGGGVSRIDMLDNQDR